MLLQCLSKCPPSPLRQAAAGRPPGDDAAREVSIHGGDDGAGGLLERERPHKARHPYQVPDQFLEHLDGVPRGRGEGAADLFCREGDVGPIQGEVIRPGGYGPEGRRLIASEMLGGSAISHLS